MSDRWLGDAGQARQGCANLPQSGQWEVARLALPRPALHCAAQPSPPPRFSLDSLKLHEPSIFESYVYGAQWMPPPFRNFQGMIHARGFDLASTHRALLILLQTIAPEELPAGGEKLPVASAKRKWLTLLPASCITLQPVPPAAAGGGAAGSDGSATAAVPAQRTEAKLLVHLDPKIPLIPGFLVNFVLGVLAPYIYKEMCRVGGRPGVCVLGGAGAKHITAGWVGGWVWVRGRESGLEGLPSRGWLGCGALYQLALAAGSPSSPPLPCYSSSSPGPGPRTLLRTQTSTSEG